MKKYVYLILMFAFVTSPTFIVTHAQDNDRFVIVATNTHVADLARVVAGDQAEVISIMGPGINPHQYRFTEKDSAALREGDIVLYNGMGFEGYLETTLEEFERQKPVFGVMNIVEIQGFGLRAWQNVDAINSHAHHDPRNWMLATQALADFLANYDPANAAFYQANSATYIAQLETLYEWGRAALQVVPADQRLIVSAHDAFAYLGYAFDWEAVAVQGISTADEAGVGDIQAIVDFVLTNRVPAIFAESSLPPDTIEAVIASARSQGWDVQLGGELLADALDAPGRFTGTYIGMMHFNITLIVTAYGYGDQLPPFPENLPQPDDYAT